MTRQTLSRLGWFVLLWAGSVTGLAIVGGIIKWALAV